MSRGSSRRICRRRHRRLDDDELGTEKLPAVGNGCLGLQRSRQRTAKATSTKRPHARGYSTLTELKVQGLSNAPEYVQENEVSLTLVKVERPFPTASARGQTKLQSLCRLPRARAWAEESKESAETTTVTEKNMLKVVEGGAFSGL